MIFQDPMTSLNPVVKIGRQITESLRYHLDMPRDQADATALSLMKSVGIPEAERRLHEYPHQMSGGMRQRIVIAVALACGPKLLFADEPTTALDVTVQAQILNLLQQQQRERDMAMVLVTHDLGVVAGRADDIAVMYAGQIVETAPTTHAVRADADAVHRRPAEVDPEARAAEPQPARDHRRPSARPHQPARRLQVLTALPVRAGPLPRRGAAARSRRRRPATTSAAGTRSVPTQAARRSSATSRRTCRRPKQRSPATPCWQRRSRRDDIAGGTVPRPSPWRADDEWPDPVPPTCARPKTRCCASKTSSSSSPSAAT